jgi:hypothetical protein
MHRFQITIIYKVLSTSCANTYIIEYQYIFIKTRHLCAAVSTAIVDGLLINQQPGCDFGRFRRQVRRVSHEAAMPSGTQDAPGWLCVTEKFRPWTGAGTMPSPERRSKRGQNGEPLRRMCRRRRRIALAMMRFTAFSTSCLSLPPDGFLNPSGRFTEAVKPV